MPHILLWRGECFLINSGQRSSHVGSRRDLKLIKLAFASQEICQEFLRVIMHEERERELPMMTSPNICPKSPTKLGLDRRNCIWS
jgi:hypothetical protein